MFLTLNFTSAFHTAKSTGHCNTAAKSETTIHSAGSVTEITQQHTGQRHSHGLQVDSSTQREKERDSTAWTAAHSYTEQHNNNEGKRWSSSSVSLLILNGNTEASEAGFVLTALQQTHKHKQEWGVSVMCVTYRHKQQCSARGVLEVVPARAEDTHTHTQGCLGVLRRPAPREHTHRGVLRWVWGQPEPRTHTKWGRGQGGDLETGTAADT